MMFRVITGVAFYAISLLTSITLAQGESSSARQSSSTDQSDLIHELLERSLAAELDAIEKSSAPVHINTRDIYWSQLHIRGRAGEPEQMKRLRDAIIAKHEDRNLERSQLWYDNLIKVYAAPETNAEGVASLIRDGELQRCWNLLSNDGWGQDEDYEPPMDNVHLSQPEADARTIAGNADRLWLTCKLATAYHRTGSPEKVRDCLNLFRRILEGEEYSGLEFDSDDDWLPASESEMHLGPKFQPRLTFYWALVASGHMETAITWFLADKESQQPNAYVVLDFSPGESLVPAFVRAVAKYSPKRAADLVRKLFDDKPVPSNVQKAIIVALLDAGDLTLANTFIQEKIGSLKLMENVAEYENYLVLKSLVDHGQVEFATDFVNEFIRISSEFEKEVREGFDPDVGRESVAYYNHSTYAHVASQAARFDESLALKLLELHANSPRLEKWDDWVLIESVKAKSGNISKVKHYELTGSCFAENLIEAYIESDQLELARQTIQDASEKVRETTRSGNSIGAGKFGLGVLDFNTYERTALAIQAIQFEDFELIRNLLNEMDRDYNRRSGYFAVTRKIAEKWGVEKALQWIKNTEHPISQSGAILGLVDFLIPEPNDQDEIPPVFRAGC